MKNLRKLGISILSMLALALTGCQDKTSSVKPASPSAPNSTQNPSAETSPKPSTPSNKPSESKPSTPTETKYKVTVDESEDYTASLDAANGEYRKGSKVTLTLTIQNHAKEMESIQADPEVEITIEENGNGTVKASFVMPEADVNVHVTLKDITHTYKISEIHNYDTSTFGELSLKEGNTFETGEKVTLTIQKSLMDFLKSAKDCYYIEVSGTMYHPVIEEAYVQSISIEFTMPSNDVVINLSYGNNVIDNSNGYAVTLEENDYVSLLGYDPNQKYTQFYSQLIRKAGYKVTSVQYKYGDGEWQNNYGSFNIDNLCNLYLYSITGNVTIKVNGTYTGVRKINYVHPDAITTAGTLYTEATEGDVYSLSFKTSTKYTSLGKPTFEGVDVPDDDVTASYFKLTMPSNDITITFPCKENGKITISENADIVSTRIYNVSAYQDSEYCQANGAFRVYPIAKDGKVVTSARTIDANGTKGGWSYADENASGEQYFELRMPRSGDCTVEFNTTDGILVTAEESEHGTFTLRRSTYRAGDTVSFSAVPESKFYKFEKLLNASTNEEIKTTMNSNSGTFTMPNVTSLKVKAIFTAIPKATVTLEGYDATKLSSFKATGSTSNAVLNGTSGAVEFLVGETVTISAGLADSVKNEELHIYKTVNGVETEIIKGTFYYTFTVEEGLTKIRIDVSSKTPEETAGFKATITKPDDVTLSFSVNYGPRITDLEGQLVPANNQTSVTLSIYVTTEKDYSLHVYDDKNNEIESTGMITKVYTISSDIRIVVTTGN